jgi:hypothetical protein
MTTFLIAATLVQQLRLTDGPAVPLSLVADRKPIAVKVFDSWNQGCHPVEFRYEFDESVAELAERCARVEGAINPRLSQSRDQFSMDRTMDGIRERVSILRQDERTFVVVYETVDAGKTPEAFYRAAVSSEPPVPMIEVPFLEGVKTNAVSFLCFDFLMVRSFYRSGDDTIVYRAFAPMLPGEAAKKLEDWAKRYGYTKTADGSWFRPEPGLFEIELTAATLGRAQITMYGSYRKADHPIVRSSF